ncbi:MAG: 2-nitropropane dioxygenase [Flavobacteriales bacterium]|nr:2-nitropropane dioxygenase [Flavobacteriales bacterium]|tara:strand:- start:3481 stop:4425 length:945 start_codon:yes stop_codon:yes gene_type:complete
MQKKLSLSEMLGIDHPIIVAPMFLVSNEEMVVQSCLNGATSAIPALNYRTYDELRIAIQNIKKRTSKPFGINLIVNKSNPKYKKQLEVLLEEKVDYIITSLGSPEETIKKCKPKGIKVFCDVVDLTYAKKVQDLGADGVIAVNNKAGGHCGPTDRDELLKQLSENISIPIISAGGVTTKADIDKAINMGACGVSVGTIFLAAEEAPISDAYKQALIDYGEKDIVLSTKISGSHLTVINTPYVQKIGTEASWLEKLMKKNKWLKKYIKLFIALRGMNMIRKSAFKATYNTVWCAGPAIEDVKSVRPLKEILDDLI